MSKKQGSKKILDLLFSEPKEIADGITIEKLSPMFFDVTKLKVQPEPLYRMDMNDHRYYYKFDENGEPQFFTSVTTMIRNTLPTSPHLIQWLIDKQGTGKDEAKERSEYGTFLHSLCAELLINGTFDLDKLSEKLTIFLTNSKVIAKDNWVDELKKDVLAFAQFVIDYNVKPLAIEIVLAHPRDGYAGAIDLVCELDVEEKGNFGEVYASGANKGQPKESKRITRMNAIIDIKSGRRGFYESHEIQLSAYEQMWFLQFPEVKIKRLFNWSPKEWRTTPSYNLKDQTDSKNIAKLPHLVALAKIEDSKRENKVTVISGIVDVLQGTDRNISEKTFVELVKSNK
jgi:hypothetical protein